MSSESYLNNIINDLQMEKLREMDRESILGYLREETDSLDLPSMKHNLSYKIFYGIEEGLEGENSRVARRALYVVSRLNPLRMISYFRYENNVYEIYKESGIDEEIVLEDVKEKIESFYNEEPRYTFNRFSQIIRRYEEKTKEDSITMLLTHYGQMLKAYGDQNELRGEHLEHSILLRGLFVIFNEKLSMGKEEAIKTLESVLLKVIGALYSQEEVEKVCEKYFGRCLLQKEVLIKGSINKETVRKRLIKLSLAVGLKCHKYSEVIRQIVRLQMVLEGPVYCESFFQNEQENQVNKVWDEIMEQFDMTQMYKIEAYSEKFLRDDIKKYGSWYEKQLKACYERDKVLVEKTFYELLEAKRLGSIVLYALLRKEGVAFNQEIVDTLELILDSFKHETVLRRAYGRTISVSDQAAMVLLEVSTKAKRRVLQALEEKQDILNKCIVAHDLFYIQMKEGVLAYLAEEIGVAQVIIAAVERNEGYDTSSFSTFIKAHLEIADQVMHEKIEGDCTISYVEAFYKQDLGMKSHTLAKAFNHKLKSVINFMEAFVESREHEIRPYFEELRKYKNKNMLEAIQRLEKKWDAKKVAQAIEAIENIEELEQYIEKVYNKANIAYIPFEESLIFDSVRSREGNRVAPIILKYYLSEYMLLKEVYVIEGCEKLKKFLNTQDLNKLINQMYTLWLQKGADTKQKNVLILYALNATLEDITTLKKQIDTWTESSRGALAAFAVTAMAMNGSNLALMLTDSIRQKYKNKQVRASAQEAIAYVAQVKGISKEALGDKIVPTLGFNPKREMILGYGSRNFKAILTPELEVILFDEVGKKVKSLPKANSSDDEQKVETAKQQLKGIKKQVKAVITSQKLRLEKAMITGRTWDIQAWQELFIENPIMNGFAMSLIWAELDSKGCIRGTFRYMEDGTFNTIDEEEYSFDEGTVIALLHPIELDKESLQTWKKQLADYEVKQGITQLELPLYTLTQEEQEGKTIERFSKRKVYFGTVMGIMDKYDWNKTSITDGGCYEGYYYEDTTTGIGIKLNLDFAYVGMEATEEIKLEDMLFYKAGTVTYGSYCYDEVTEQNSIKPKDVPIKVLNFALMVGELICTKEISI